MPLLYTFILRLNENGRREMIAQKSINLSSSTYLLLKLIDL